MHGSCMWEIYVIRGILDCARWNNIGLTTYAFFFKLQAIIKQCTGSTCMYIYIKAATDPKNWIWDSAGSDPDPDPDPDPLTYGTFFISQKMPKMHNFWPISFANF